MWSRSSPATRYNRSQPFSNSRRRPLHPQSTSQRRTLSWLSKTSSPTSTLRCSLPPQDRKRWQFGRSWQALASAPGKTFETKDLSLERKAAVLLGMKQGEDKVEQYLATGQKNINGWKVGSLFGDRAFFNGDWLKRAAAAKGGIYGNDAVEAMYPLTKTLADGEELNGSKHNYTLTFAKGQFPPVNAFWSVTMYDGKSQLLIENPINPHLINSPMLSGMKKNPDGSLTMYIQKDSPGKAKESNWLPAPNDTIYLVMRLYWPKETPPSILPAGEGTWQPPAIVASS